MLSLSHSRSAPVAAPPDTDLSEDDLDTAAMYRQQAARQQTHYLQQRQQRGAQGAGVRGYARSIGWVDPELLRAQAFALAARFQPRYDLNFELHSELPREPTQPRAAHPLLAELFSQQPSRLGQLWSDAELRSGPLHHELPRCTLDEFHVVKETLWMLAGVDTFVYISTAVDADTVVPTVSEFGFGFGVEVEVEPAATASSAQSSLSPPPPLFAVVTARRDVKLTHITPTALTAALSRFASAGTDVRYLTRFVSEALSLSDQDGIPRSYQAFAAWLETYLHEFHGRLVALESQLLGGASSRSSRLGISKLTAAMRGDSKKLRRLVALLKRGTPESWTGANARQFNNARLSARLLEVLHSVSFFFITITQKKAYPTII